jgi:hypothetical protein
MPSNACHAYPPQEPVSERPWDGFQQLNKGQILSFPPASARAAVGAEAKVEMKFPPHIRLCSRLQTGYQHAINAFSFFLVFKARPSS